MNAQQLTVVNAELRDYVVRLRREADELHGRLRAAETELAILRTRLDEATKRIETWSTRAWSLIPIFIGAILSLSAGLIVALVKR